jgi:hypothetical protein
MHFASDSGRGKMGARPHIAWGERHWRRVEHMSRLRAIIAVAFGSFSLACSGGDPESTAPLEPAASPPDPVIDEAADDSAVVDPDWGLAFSIRGRSVPITARAELKVVEGQRAVHVAITSRTAGTDDMLKIDLTFDGIENAIGFHQEQFSLPEGGAHMANGNLDGNWYYSQGGTIELSVNREGDIEGTFDIALAPHLDPGVFEASDEATRLGGEFSGSWVLNCRSHLPGHRSLISGGYFCENLVY